MVDQARKVIDWKTREPWAPVEVEPTDEERVAAAITMFSDGVFMNIIKIRALGGLDMALRVLHQTATDIKNYGKS